MKGWKKIDDDTDAMIVPTGMIVRTRHVAESGNGISIAVSMVFVPRLTAHYSYTEKEFVAWIEVAR